MLFDEAEGLLAHLALLVPDFELPKAGNQLPVLFQQVADEGRSAQRDGRGAPTLAIDALLGRWIEQPCFGWNDHDLDGGFAPLRSARQPVLQAKTHAEPGRYRRGRLQLLD